MKDGGDRPSMNVPALVKKFSFKDLVLATQIFQLSLGDRGFGSVFEGNGKGIKILAKCLNNHGRGEFFGRGENHRQRSSF